MISIIIPVFNEEKTIVSCLENLVTQCASQCVLEILLVDGGSTDHTAQHISEFISSKPKIPTQLLFSEKGRAVQMNKGAEQAKGSILYFLHADGLPPEHFDELITEEIKKENYAGCFRIKFDDSHWWLQLMGWFTRFNEKSCRGGDQSLFVTKKLFEEIGGFDESFIVYEDNDFIQKLYTMNQFTVIQKPLITSARKYREVGVGKLQYYYLMIYFKKWLGSTPEELYAYYKSKVENN